VSVARTTGCGFFEEGEFAWQPRRDWIWPGPGKSAKVLVSWMAQMAGSQWGQAIPTKLSGAQFEQFVLPHLSRGTRGPASKLSPHAIFNYILKLLYLGCQWKELPIEKDRDGRPEIHHTRIYRAFRRWEAQGCIAAVFAGSVLKLHQAELLDISIIHGDGTTTAAKKGGDNIGFSGHKKMKGDKVVAFCDRNCNVIAPFVAAPGNGNESPLLREALPLVTRIAREIGMNLQGTVVSLDGVYDCRDNRKAIFNRGMTPNINPNPRGRKTPKQGRKPLFEPWIFEERFSTIERVFGWEDKFRRLLLRFDRLSYLHYAFKTLAYTMINLRHFCRE
jgi:transposase